MLAEIIKYVKAGGLPYPATSKIVVAGHSFGSGSSNGILSSYPDLADAAILTGVAFYGVNGVASVQAKQNRVASLVDPQKWGKLDPMYSTWVDKWSNAEQ